MQLTQSEIRDIQLEFNRYENIRAVSIEALKIVQKNRGWISDETLRLIAQILNISVADIEGVATFYNQIFRQPVGQNIIRYCDSVVCYIAGSKKIQEVLENLLNVKIGNTTRDNKFTLLPICCVGRCDKPPIIMINEDIYSCVIPSKIMNILRFYS